MSTHEKVDCKELDCKELQEFDVDVELSNGFNSVNGRLVEALRGINNDPSSWNVTIYCAGEVLEIQKMAISHAGSRSTLFLPKGFSADFYLACAREILNLQGKIETITEAVS